MRTDFWGEWKMKFGKIFIYTFLALLFLSLGAKNISAQQFDEDSYNITLDQAALDKYGLNNSGEVQLFKKNLDGTYTYRTNDKSSYDKILDYINKKNEQSTNTSSSPASSSSSSVSQSKPESSSSSSSTTTSSSGGSGKKGALFSQLTKSGSTIFEGMKMIIYAVAGFGIVGVAIGGFFGNLNWKWLSAIIIGLLVIAMTAGILMYMTESDIKENAITIQDSLINAS